MLAVPRSYQAGVGGQIIIFIRHDAADLLDQEIVHAHFLRIALLASVAASALEIADQLLLLSALRTTGFAAVTVIDDDAADAQWAGLSSPDRAARAGETLFVNREAQLRLVARIFPCVLHAAHFQAWRARHRGSLRHPYAGRIGAAWPQADHRGRLVSRAIVRGLERRRRDQGRGDAAPHGSLRDRPLTRWTLPRRIALGLGDGGLVFFSSRCGYRVQSPRRADDGLRVSEVAALKVGDVYCVRMVMRIARGKGGKNGQHDAIRAAARHSSRLLARSGAADLFQATMAPDQCFGLSSSSKKARDRLSDSFVVGAVFLHFLD